MKKILGFLFLSGCMVGPNYRAPDIVMPDSFVEADGAQTITDEDLCGWWKQFSDPLLDSFIEEAAKGNYDYLIALEQIVAARAEYQIQSSYLWPQINLNAITTRNRYSQNLITEAANAQAFASGQGVGQIGAMGNPVQNFFQVGFDAIWELDVWGQFRRAKQAALDQWEASQYMANGVLISVIAEVVRDYVTIRSLQQQIDLTKKKVAADERELALTKVLFVAGLADEIAVQSQESALDSDLAQLPLLETSLKQMIYAFAVLLGKQPESLNTAFDEIRPIPQFIGKVPAGLPSELLRRRPDIGASERNLAAATEQIGIAISALYPSIALTGNGIGLESNTSGRWFKHRSAYWTIGPSINWDLIDFGKTFGQIDMANSQQRQALYAYQNTVIAALQDVEGALVAYFEEQTRNDTLVDKVTSDSRSFALNLDLFQAGLASEIQELESLKTLLDSQNLLVQSEQAVASNLISLYKAMGGDWECSSTP